MVVCALIVAVCIAIVAVLLVLLKRSRTSMKNKTHVDEEADVEKKSHNPDSSHVAADSVVIDGGVSGRNLINASDYQR